jgi:glycosyltransferase involved in cell wall biosynthesis
VSVVSTARVLIVVPTIGTRLEFLDRCLDSIATQDIPVDIVIVAPDSDGVRERAERVGAQLLPDPGSLAGAINVGVASAGQRHDFVNWLGDDDLLESGSLKLTTAALDANPDAVVAYGACRYIDADDTELWVSQAGPWASRILSWGPDLIPQPGMLVRADAWRTVGGVDASYRFAFDLDLLLKLKAIGRLHDVGAVVSSFRWHPDSLTVGDRTTNLEESERAKRAALGPTARRMAWMWEGPVRVATRFAANEVTRRAHRAAAKASA